MDTTQISDVAGLMANPAFLTVLRMVLPLLAVGLGYALGSYLFESVVPDESELELL
jgi:hypothetical protein